MEGDGSMVEITRKDMVECRCCGTIYRIFWGPRARDTGSVDCQECGGLLMTWKDTAIPTFKVASYNTRHDAPMATARRRYG